MCNAATMSNRAIEGSASKWWTDRRSGADSFWRNQVQGAAERMKDTTVANLESYKNEFLASGTFAGMRGGKTGGANDTTGGSGGSGTDPLNDPTNAPVVASLASQMNRRDIRRRSKTTILAGNAPTASTGFGGKTLLGS